MTNKCIVFQPFDEDEFDSRYDEILVPAIEDAGLQPYRVDRDSSATIIMDKLHKEVRDSSACLADISEDNPNVWYELGFAIATEKPVVIVCSKERQRFPFDIQHRRIIRYSSGAPSDLVKMKASVTEALTALINKVQILEQVAHRPTEIELETEGLKQPEIAVIAIVMANQKINNWTSKLHADMEKAGFPRVTSVLALGSLSSKGFIRIGTSGDEDSGETEEAAFLTNSGKNWLSQYQDKINLYLFSPAKK